MYNSSRPKFQPDYQYYDMCVTNRETTLAQFNTPLRFSDIRSQPLIYDASEYYLSVVRFSLDSFSLPLFECAIQPNQGDRDLSIYSVTLEWTDGVSIINTQPEYIQWSPVNQDVPVPPAPNANSNGYQTDSPYYYSYNFEHMIRLINNAIVLCMDKLKALVGASIDSVENPFLHWNIQNQSATLYTPLEFDQKQATHIKLYINRSMYTLFNTFPVIQLSHNISRNRHYLIVVRDEKVNIKQSEGVGIEPYLVTEQERSCVANWNIITSIMFTSPNLPVVQNDLSPPLILENNSPVQLGTNNSPNQPIISDFQVEEPYSPHLLYYPSGEYRRISMYQSEIREVQVNIYWRDRLGRIKAMYLDPGATASLKIMFERRNKNV